MQYAHQDECLLHTNAEFTHSTAEAESSQRGGSSLPWPALAHMLCHFCKRIALSWKYPRGFFLRILERAQLRMRIRRMHHIEWWFFSFANFKECRTSGIYWTYRFGSFGGSASWHTQSESSSSWRIFSLKLIDESAGWHFRRWEECCPVLVQVPVNLHFLHPSLFSSTVRPSPFLRTNTPPKVATSFWFVLLTHGRIATNHTMDLSNNYWGRDVRHHWSQFLHDCVSFVTLSRNSNKMTFRLSHHARSSNIPG